MVQGMNFSRLIITRHSFFLLLLFTLPCISSLSVTYQSDYVIPFSYTTHITPPNNSSDLCCITPLGSDKLVIANKRNLWIYDGKYWEPIPTQGLVNVIPKNDSEVIVSDSLGIVILKSEENGFIRIDSVFSIRNHKGIGQILGLAHSTDGTIYFSTTNNIWELSGEPKQIQSSEHSIRIYSDFYFIEDKGVFCIKSQKPIIGSKKIEQIQIINIFNIKKDNVIIQSSFPWVSSVNGGKLIAFGNLSSTFQPTDFEITKAAFQNGELYLLTNREGLIILDEEGNYKTRIISTPSVNFEQITSFFAPSANQVIALSANGIHMLQRPERAGQYSKTVNLHISPNQFLFHNKTVYCGHTKGLSYAELLPNNAHNISFKMVDGINEEISMLVEESGNIIAHGKKTLYYIKNNQVVSSKKTVPSVQSNSSVKSSNNKNSLHLTNELYSEVAYIIDKTDSLILLKRILNDFPEYSPLWIAEHASSNQLETIHFIGIIPAMETIKQVSISEDSTIWIATSDGLKYFTTTNEQNNSKPSVSIHSISFSSKQKRVLYKNGYLTGNNTLLNKGQKSPVSNVSINLSSLSFYRNELATDLVLYSTFVEGYDTCWTKWTAHNVREIGKLKHGDYKIWAKTMNIAGEESDKVYVELTILPRFYETKFAYISFLILAFVGLYMVLSWRSYIHAKVRFKLESLINKRTEELVKEKEKTDNLLARVLPHDTASELKEKGKVNTQRFKMVTVLFSDIEGFTRITDETNPETLIDQLDKFFLYFDSVVERYRIEKIKTIGDAYMCAGGIPEKNRTNPVEVILAALEMMQFMKSITSSSSKKSKVWELRIGIDTGPVIAGVVGRSKLTYDIWGSTVNTASRMESSGEVGQINISGNTYMLVKDYFICTYRGKMPVKNKGDIQMYFVNGIKPSLSEGMQGVKPNHDFFIQLQLIRLGDLEDFILEKLEKGLPKELYYHNLKHTVDVYTQVELIGRSENVSKEEMLLLRTAALFHDAGHLIDYDTHEEMAVKLIREILPEYQYSEKQIDVISQLIMVTKLPPQPKNLLEEIMCDADLDYLGRPDFIPVSNMLYKELHEHGKIGTLREWNELQIKFIDKHHYFTKTARRLRNVNKQSQLDKLKRWMENN